MILPRKNYLNIKFYSFVSSSITESSCGGLPPWVASVALPVIFCGILILSLSTIFDGSRNPAILDGGLKIDPFSAVSFDKLDFENSIERIQMDMAKALGVPYVLLKSGNNANIDANQKLFYLQTILPMLSQFCSAFSHYFNNGITIRPDRLVVPALQPDNRTQAVYYSTLVNTGIITPNEAREGLRFPKMENNDTIRIPQNITGSATDASQGGRPSQEESNNLEDTTNE